MIPVMIVAGLVFGRWWKLALVSAAIAWPILLVATGVTRSFGTLFGAALLAAANAAVGVVVHQAALRLVRRLRPA